MKKQIIIFILLVLILVIFNNILSGRLTDTSVINTNELVNREHVSSQKLFEKTWRIINNNFYDANLNGQDWNRWKKHYRGKIKTDEDANVAINTMLESLDDPYSRYLNKHNYAEQNSSIDSKISGIGVNISTLGGKTYVVNVIED
ncbi:MAG: hypothetical protein PHC64_07580, partial [Candidatus Gastranaerophilales bacterium]|nr:hypothetical protein [Candidatus Gastranaerophilales bacterium]